jgi:hypothetical protein
VGRRLLCAKLADPAPVGVARGRGPAVGAIGMSAGHGPLHAARGRSPAAAIRLWWTCDPHSFAGG